jgi:hypothetical protein
VQQLRPFVPLALPFLIVAAAWVLVIGPAGSAASKDAARLDALRARLASARGAADGHEPAAPAVDPVAAFERQVSSRDAAAELLGHLTRLALSAGARNLSIDSTAAPVVVASGTGPRAAGGAEPDRRLALFGIPLQYSEMPVSFDASYAAVGQFLWSLHSLPVVAEVREMTVTPRAQSQGGVQLSRSGAVPADATVSVSLTLFVYARPDAAPVPMAQEEAAR